MVFRGLRAGGNSSWPGTLTLLLCVVFAQSSTVVMQFVDAGSGEALQVSGTLSVNATAESLTANCANRSLGLRFHHDVATSTQWEEQFLAIRESEFLTATLPSVPAPCWLVASFSAERNPVEFYFPEAPAVHFVHLQHLQAAKVYATTQSLRDLVFQNASSDTTLVDATRVILLSPASIKKSKLLDWRTWVVGASTVALLVMICAGCLAEFRRYWYAERQRTKVFAGPAHLGPPARGDMGMLPFTGPETRYLVF